MFLWVGHLDALTWEEWCTIRDDFRNLLMSEGCMEMAQMVANLA